MSINPKFLHEELAASLQLISRQLSVLLLCGTAENYIRDTFYAHLILKGVKGVRRDYRTQKSHTARGMVDVAMEVDSEVPTFIEFKQLALDFPEYNDCLENPIRDLVKLGGQRAHKYAVVVSRFLVEETPLCIPAEQVHKLKRELKHGSRAFTLLDDLFRIRAAELGGTVYPVAGDRRAFEVFSEDHEVSPMKVFAWVIHIEQV